MCNLNAMFLEQRVIRFIGYDYRIMWDMSHDWVSTTGARYIAIINDHVCIGFLERPEMHILNRESPIAETIKRAWLLYDSYLVSSNENMIVHFPIEKKDDMRVQQCLIGVNFGHICTESTGRYFCLQDQATREVMVYDHTLKLIARVETSWRPIGIEIACDLVHVTVRFHQENIETTPTLMRFPINKE